MGEVAAENAMHGNLVKLTLTTPTACIHTEVAMCDLTEDARAKYVDVLIGKIKLCW